MHCDRQPSALYVFTAGVFAVGVWAVYLFMMTFHMGKTLPTHFPIWDFLVIHHVLLLD